MAPQADPSWSELIVQIARSDRHALSRLYDATHRIVYGLSLRILRDAPAAEDVTVETFINVWRAAGSFDPERGSASAWLCTLARNRAIDRLRADARQPASDLVGLRETARGDDDPEHNAALAQERKVVREALASLNADERQAIELAYYEGLSHSEIAKRLAEPLGTVKARVRRGMLKLRDQLALVLK